MFSLGTEKKGILTLWGNIRYLDNFEMELHPFRIIKLHNIFLPVNLCNPKKGKKTQQNVGHAFKTLVPLWWINC